MSSPSLPRRDLQTGQNALHFAAVTGQTDAARALLDAGIPVDAPTSVSDVPHDGLCPQVSSAIPLPWDLSRY
jgi:hypothetical protein